MNLSVIIVNYNVRTFIENCLKSFWSETSEHLDFEVFIVDNNSSDGSVEHLQNAFPKDDYPNLHFIANKTNAGFGKANNQALARAKGDYILFLNPDTLLRPTTLKECFDFAESKNDFGAMGVKMLSADGVFAPESKRGLPTPWTSFCKMSGLSALFPKSKTFARYHLTYLDENQPHEIEIISGAFMFASKKALDQCGGFDEDFFMYGEDVDLSCRIIKAGFRNFYFPTPIIHYKGESTKKSSYKYVKTFYEAMLIFYSKHYPKSNFLLTLLIRAAIYGRAAAELIIRKTKALFKAQ